MAEFVFERRVEFCETDAAGIAHFSSLLQYAEQAEHALLRSLGMTVHSGRDSDYVWPRVHVEMDFAGPIRFEENVSVVVTVMKLGESSVRYRFRLEGPNGPVARSETVAVCCVKSQDTSGHVRMIKVAIPGSLRGLLAGYLES